MVTDLYLVRHGQVHADWQGRIYGCLDVPLSDQGREEARRAAQQLAGIHLDGVACSGLSRTRYGAETIAKGRGLELLVDVELRELERGDWAGMTFEELEVQRPGAMSAWRADPWTTRPPSGESMDDLAARVLPALDRLTERFPKGSLAVVAHSHVVRCAIARALGKPAAMQLEVPTAATLHFHWTPDGPAELVSTKTLGNVDDVLARNTKT
ncbi:MAG: histidine phosphatase family protein [Planctomycetota bacterium]|nr:histidine phosphatase family protein [Planctomycetota bacterium]